MSSTHFNSDGEARMVDVSQKDTTTRTATAEACITMTPSTMQMIRRGAHKKGDVLAVARLAAIMATKQTQQLIPLCHAIPIEAVEVTFTPESETDRAEDTGGAIADAPAPADSGPPQTSSSLTARLACRVTVRTTAKTGVEMEAMTGAAVAALTVYDMCKSVDRDMEVQAVRLLAKTGGKSGDYRRGSV